jgi:hypothetical protein
VFSWVAFVKPQNLEIIRGYVWATGRHRSCHLPAPTRLFTDYVGGLVSVGHTMGGNFALLKRSGALIIVPKCDGVLEQECAWNTRY